MNIDIAKSLKECVYDWLCENPGSDSEDVSVLFEISGYEAGRLVEELLNEGRLECCDY